MTTRRTAQVLGSIAVLMMAATVAQADSFIQNPIFSSNDALIWSNISVNNNFIINTGQTILTTPGGNTVTISFPSSPVGENGILYTQGAGWLGGTNIFVNGDQLLATHPAHAGDFDTITLTFSTNISAIGFLIQGGGFSTPGTSSFTATITTDNGGSASATSTLDPVYLGIADSTGANIHSVTIDVPIASITNQAHLFAIDTGSLREGTVPGNTPGVPEPGSLLLMAGGVAAFAWKVRRRNA